MSREFLEHAQAAADPDGRLPLGAMADWEVFPFEAESLRARPLTEYAVPEPDRSAPPAECRVCAVVAEERLLLYGGDQLIVGRTRSTSLAFEAQVLSREHLKLEELDEAAYAEMGVLVGRTYTAMRALDGVGNVHVNKWENGKGHLRVNLLARPVGVLQLRGSNLPIWADMLPPIAEDEFAARAELVRQALA